MINAILTSDDHHDGEVIEVKSPESNWYIYSSGTVYATIAEHGVTYMPPSTRRFAWNGKERNGLPEFVIRSGAS
jgi:uncharacterized membrane protein